MKAPSMSIAELEGVEWTLPPKSPPALIRCLEIRKKPISALSVSDLRALIGQDVGLDLVMPLALDKLENDPLLEAEHYRGDLLAAVLRVSAKFYRTHQHDKARVEDLLKSLPGALDELERIDFDTTSVALEEAVALFNGNS